MEIRLKKLEYGGMRHFAYGDMEEFKCSKCKKQIEEGFICENNTKLLLCNKCQEKFKMKDCKHDKIGEHRHIKFWREDE